MRYRKFGRAGFEVSEIGYGAWGISKVQWVGADDAESLRSLNAAHDAGVNFYDTALAYGDGHSENLIRQAFGSDPKVLVASKVPPKNLVWSVKMGSPLRETFPRQYVLDCLDITLRNLGRDYVDVYQFHTWIDDWASEDEWLNTVRTIRDSGKARTIGISIQGHQPENVLKALDTGLIDAVQVIYNIFDQSPEDKLFPYCEKKGIAVIARVPFDEGSLTGKIRPDTQFAADDFRNNYFRGDRKQQVWDRVQQIASDTGVSVDDMPDLALRFCLSHPAVSTVIPGMRSTKHVASNVRASDAGSLTAAQLDSLRQHRWVREFYD